MAYHGKNQNTLKTHCRRGHEFTRENTREKKNGRACIACEKLYYIEHRQPLTPLPSEEERFWAGVDRTPGLGPGGDCWEWRRSCYESGYGQAKYKGKGTNAHRAAYQYTHGPIVGGREVQVMHACDNRKCVNPAHLSLGSAFDNIADMVAKGRHHGQQITHCKQGHPFTADNTRIVIRRGSERRQCLACRAERDAARYQTPERQQYNRENVDKRRDSLRQYARQRYANRTNEQRAATIVKRREWYAKNKEKQRQYQNDWRKARRVV